jgi:hypothetical protein
VLINKTTVKTSEAALNHANTNLPSGTVPDHHFNVTAGDKGVFVLAQACVRCSRPYGATRTGVHVRSGGLCGVIAAGLLAGCGSPQAPAAEHAGSAYELVLLEKPDSVEGYAKIDRGVYDLCVVSTQVSHTAAKPFPKLPESLGATRTTYLIRGRDRVVRREMLATLDVSKNTPDNQCEVDVITANGLNVDLVVGTMHTSIGSDDTGRPVVNTQDISDLRRADARSLPQSTAHYTEASTVNGIELRCLPKGKPPLDDVFLTEQCVYAHDGVLVEPDGKAIILASRVKITANYPFVTVTEPQSLRTIEHPDPSQFSAAAYTR